MIQLRPYEPCDADTIISWIGDEVAFRKWCADRYETYPITAAGLSDIFDGLIARKTDRYGKRRALVPYGRANALFGRLDKNRLYSGMTRIVSSM